MAHRNSPHASFPLLLRQGSLDRTVVVVVAAWSAGAGHGGPRPRRARYRRVGPVGRRGRRGDRGGPRFARHHFRQGRGRRAGTVLAADREVDLTRAVVEYAWHDEDAEQQRERHRANGEGAAGPTTAGRRAGTRGQAIRHVLRATGISSASSSWLPQCGQPSTGVRLDRALGDAERGGDLGLAEVAEIAKGDDLAWRRDKWWSAAISARRRATASSSAGSAADAGVGRRFRVASIARLAATRSTQPSRYGASRSRRQFVQSRASASAATSSAASASPSMRRARRSARGNSRSNAVLEVVVLSRSQHYRENDRRPRSVDARGGVVTRRKSGRQGCTSWRTGLHGLADP